MQPIGEGYAEKYDVTALGELLIDFTENGVSEQGNIILEANPGGAPCNVLAMLEKLGKKLLLSARLEMIPWTSVKRTIESAGIDSHHLVMDKRVILRWLLTYCSRRRQRLFFYAARERI